ncbi:MAG: sulfatase [Flavobacteriaceae bacterium]|nr:sulfatase [Flavobacteriaceae bacterium]
MLLLTLLVYSQENKKPNILFISVDDLKPTIGSFGDDFAVTPNIDKLSETSTVFLNNHTQLAICAASRVSFLTGLRPDKTKVWDLKTKMRDVNPDVLTLPEHFKNNGYQTIGVGKIYDPRAVDGGRDRRSWSVPFVTQNQLTFPDGYSFPSGGFYQGKENRAVRAKLRQEAIDKGVNNLNKYESERFKPPYENADVPDGAYMDGAIANRAVELLDQMDNTKPFFLAVGFLRPHLPFNAPTKYWNLYKEEEIQLAEFQTKSKNPVDIAYKGGWEINTYKAPGIEYIENDEGLLILPDDIQRKLIHGYYAATSYIDAQIGLVLKKLKEKGLDKNTIIVLWGDHGFHLGDHSQWTKHTNFEQSTRSPLLIKDPRINKTINVDSPTEFIDVFPTLCELAKLEIPEELDGISLKPQILGEQTTSKIFAVSQYPRHGNIMGYSFRTKRHRYTVWVNNKKSFEPIYIEDIYAEELYDYTNDPLETENIIDNSEQLRIKTAFQTLAARFFNSQIVNEPEPIVNELKTNIPKPSPNNKWANQRSKTISQYISSEMMMNKNQLKFLQQALYDKYARNNEMTAGKNLSKDQTETVYKENFSIASQELLSRFTKKQFERISELESQKMKQLRN